MEHKSETKRDSKNLWLLKTLDWKILRFSGSETNENAAKCSNIVECELLLIIVTRCKRT